MIIRLVQERDYLEWLHMRKQLWPHCSMEDHQQEIRSWLADLKRFPVFIAEDGDTLLGFLEASIYELEPGAAHSRVAYVEGWYVKENYRRRGIGRKLVEGAEMWAKGRQFSRILSDTEIFNGISVKVHEQLGFKEMQRTTQEIIFTKDLA